jgi:molybdopterin converting factor small subunit
MAENGSITVTIKYMVNLSEKAGRKEESVEFPEEATLQTVAAWIRENRDITIPSPSIMATMNGRGWNQYAEKEQTRVEDGAKIMLFPPISGG